MLVAVVEVELRVADDLLMDEDLVIEEDFPVVDALAVEDDKEEEEVVAGIWKSAGISLSTFHKESVRMISLVPSL